MSRDLILLNPDKHKISIKQVMSILIREIVGVDELDNLNDLLSFFKKGMTHICIVTKVVTAGQKDSMIKASGIITLEDIIEEILEDEIEDETQNVKHRMAKLIKEKLVVLLTNVKAEKVLNANEVQSILEFIENYVGAFQNFPRNKLKQLIL